MDGAVLPASTTQNAIISFLKYTHYLNLTNSRELFVRNASSGNIVLKQAIPRELNRERSRTNYRLDPLNAKRPTQATKIQKLYPNIVSKEAFQWENDLGQSWNNSLTLNDFREFRIHLVLVCHLIYNASRPPGRQIFMRTTAHLPSVLISPSFI